MDNYSPVSFAHRRAILFKALQTLLNESKSVPFCASVFWACWKNLKTILWFFNQGPSGDSTARQLLHVMNSTRSLSFPLPGCGSSYSSVPLSSSDRMFRNSLGIDCDEVYPHLFIGNAESAKSKSYLKLMGITHVLNTAEGKMMGQVDTDHLYYRDCPRVKYLGFQMMDHPSTDISKYFYIAAKFIAEGIASGGKVLVHCVMGVSRSATCALAYLMIKRNMSAAEAMRVVRRSRNVRPNDGFLRQLCQLDNELRRERH